MLGFYNYLQDPVTQKDIWHSTSSWKHLKSSGSQLELHQIAVRWSITRVLPPKWGGLLKPRAYLFVPAVCWCCPGYAKVSTAAVCVWLAPTAAVMPFMIIFALPLPPPPQHPPQGSVSHMSPMGRLLVLVTPCVVLLAGLFWRKWVCLSESDERQSLDAKINFIYMNFRSNIFIFQSWAAWLKCI